MTDFHDLGPVRKITATRVLIVIGALTVAGLTIAGAAITPLPEYTVTPIVSEREPAVAVDTKVCPGSALELSFNPIGDSLLYEPVGRSEMVGEYQSAPVALTGNRERGQGAPVKIEANVGEIVYAAQSQSPESETVTGLASVSCNIPLREGWLLGASTTIGRSSILLLNNPSDVISQVKIDVRSIEGQTQADEIAVGANSQVAISLASWIPGSEALAVHFVTHGGLIAAQIQTSTVRGLETGGVDYILPVDSPQTDQVIPGIFITNFEETLALISGESYNDLRPRLIVWNPGIETADAEIYIIPSQETQFSNEFSSRVDPGEIQIIDLNGLEPGNYSVQLLGTQELVAVASAGNRSEDAIDFAWFGVATSFSAEESIQISDAPNAFLTVVNPGREPASFSLASGGYSGNLEPQEAVTIPVESGELVTLNVSEGSISTAVTYSSNMGISSYALVPKLAAVDSVTMVSLY